MFTALLEGREGKGRKGKGREGNLEPLINWEDRARGSISDTKKVHS